MNKRLAQLLYKQSKDLAKKFSDPNRAGNTNQENFEMVGIKPLSDHVATVTFSKDSGKLSIAIALYIKGYDKGAEAENNTPWYLFFPTDSHLLGLCGIKELKGLIEDHNWKLNFGEGYTIKWK